MIRQGPLLSHGQPYGGDPTTSTVVAGYRLTEKLGSGSFAVVYKGELVVTPSSATGNTNSNNSTRLLPHNSNKPAVVAIKAISLTSDRLTKKVLANLQVEIAILQKLQHENIVRMTEAVQSMDQLYFYMVLEYCAGGDVQNLIRSRENRRLSERLVRRLLRDLANGLSFLWHQELIHRDIKPQNLLLTTFLPYEELTENPPRHDVGVMNPATTTKDQHDDATPPPTLFALKIADFGFARHLQSTSLAETLCGSPLYMAPEILQHQRYVSLSSRVASSSLLGPTHKSLHHYKSTTNTSTTMLSISISISQQLRQQGRLVERRHGLVRNDYRSTAVFG
jgi:serine/threonine-protein kinase ULK2